MRYPWSEEEPCVKNLRYLNCILSWKQMANATSIQHTSDELYSYKSSLLAWQKDRHVNKMPSEEYMHTFYWDMASISDPNTSLGVWFMCLNSINNSWSVCVYINTPVPELSY
jgi:hypothetical protein